jgi:hypothetical protein
MFAHTDSGVSPWFVAEAENERRARITRGYQRPPREQFRHVPDHAATLSAD